MVDARDVSVDVLVVGSGNGALTAALCAYEMGAKDVLVVVSKLKAYVKARSGMSTSDGAVDVLSAHLRKLCDQAIAHAGTAGRKTVMDRDFEAILRASFKSGG